MVEIKKNLAFQISLPKDYQLRYTIRFLIELKKITEGKTKRQIISELSKALSKSKKTAVGPDMLFKYEGERSDSHYAELSHDRMKIIADYFGVRTDLLVTENVK